ncbi:hypothetical protein Nepgr_014762 [Nepenthes gracilis]|uniref:Uncharacterized protein n=1 Tax=Nepenthes gracilis TaxID=150966 RepID=A0AAD3SLS9_NEPGR|nr:hypothetical protein Nepgr_014762 [Nepenthes gracilis]
MRPVELTHNHHRNDTPQPKLPNLLWSNIPKNHVTLDPQRSLAPKARCSSTSGASSARALDVLSASPSPSSFLSSYASEIFQVELPDSVEDAGVSQGELDGLTHLPVHLVAEILSDGLASPAQSPNGSFPCKSGSSVACGSEAGAAPLISSSSPCQCHLSSSSNLLGVPPESVSPDPMWGYSILPGPSTCCSVVGVAPAGHTGIANNAVYVSLDSADAGMLLNLKLD